jgi:hypothetical protein
MRFSLEITQFYRTFLVDLGPKFCRPFLEAAEIALIAAKCGHPNCFLVFHDP